jgi:hypothetical protein
MANTSDKSIKCIGFTIISFLIIANTYDIYVRCKYWLDQEKYPRQFLYYEGTIFEVSSTFWDPFINYIIAVKFMSCLLGFYALSKDSLKLMIIWIIAIILTCFNRFVEEYSYFVLAFKNGNSMRVDTLEATLKFFYDGELLSYTIFLVDFKENLVLF